MDTAKQTKKTYDKKPYVNKQNGKKPFQKRDNKKPQVSKKSSIKKRTGLKYIDMGKLPDKRMYRISIIFGSTTIADTFIVDKPYVTSMVAFRDKLLASYQDLLKLVNKDVIEGMILKPYTKELPTSDVDIINDVNKDVVHRITQVLYTASDKSNSLEFPTIVNVSVRPGNVVKGVTKRIVIRLNYVHNPNFSPKKSVSENKKQVKKPQPRKMVVVSKKPRG